MAVTGDAFFVPHGLGQGLTHSNPHILHCVVGIDVQITFGADP